VTPTSGDTTSLLDTSAAVAFLMGDHDHHDETFSALTRLPPPARRTPAVVARLLAQNFPETRFLGVERAAAVLRSLSDGGLGGGSVYDALVAATAVEHDLWLVSRDRRALDTYRAFGAEVELLA